MSNLILTNTGQSKLTAATSTGDSLLITHMAVGDANER